MKDKEKEVQDEGHRRARDSLSQRLLFYLQRQKSHLNTYNNFKIKKT